MPMLASRAAAALRNWGFSGTTLLSRLRDTYFKYVTLLLRGNNADVDYALTASPDVLAVNRDSSANNFTLTLAGNTKPSVYNPYQHGYYSCYFDGTGDFLSTAALDWTMAGDFTIEAWINADIVSAGPYAICGQQSGVNWFDFRYYTNNFQISFNAASGTNMGGTLVAGRWTHVAAIRRGTAVNVYVNGVATATTITNSSTLGYSGIAMNIGSSSGNLFQGHISNFRILKGVALYANSQSPVPTTPLTPITGTSIIACQANRLIDTGPNNYALTKNGDVYVRQAHPYTLSYSAAVPSGYSVYFDGTGDYLNAGSNAAFAFGTNPYTVELWVYPTSALASTQVLVRMSATSGWQLYYENTTYGIGIAVVGTASFLYTGIPATSLRPGRWYHIAISRVSTAANSTYIYVNGMLRTTGTDSNNWTVTGPLTIGANSSGTETFTGYISNVRIVNGTALYPGTNFTLPTSALTAVTNTSFLSCQDLVIKDNSTNAFAITRNGDVVASSFHPFGDATTVKLPATYYGVYFDGTGDFITSAGSTAFTFGTGDFTVEYWVFHTSVAATYNQHVGAATTSAGFAFGTNGTALKMYMTTSTVGYTSTGTSFVLNRWHHVAYCRSSGTVTFFLDGLVNYTVAAATNITETGLGLGGAPSGTVYPMTGYLSNVRVIKGTALYTTAFVPSTAALTAVAGTSLLTCQSSTVIDNSSASNTLTINGDASPVYVNLANPSTGLDTRYLGSAYFDGTYDYFEIASNAAFGFGTGDYTLEAWIYIIGAATTNGYMILDFRNVGNGADGKIILYLNNANALTVNIGTTIIIASGVTILQNQWYHVAVARSGTNTKLFVNGAQKGSTYVGSQDLGATARPVIGNVADASATYNASWNGYISDVRIVKGSAVYTTAFIPPVQPLTAVTNTQLLTLQNRGGLSNNFFLDAGSISNSSVTKTANTGLSTFTPNGGGWSVYFDGSGDYLSLPYTAASFNCPTSFTIEFWAFPVSKITLYPTIFSNYSTYTTNGLIGIFCGHNSNSTKWSVAFNGTDGVLVSTSTIVYNSWVHIAIVRNGTAMAMYVNGVSESTSTQSATLVGTANSIWIGASGDSLANTYYNGYISNLRFINGQALYTATFTTSTTPLAPITSNATVYTSLLTCNDSYFKDWAQGNSTITKAGDAAILRTNPFGNYQLTPRGYGYLFAGAGSYLTSTTTIDMYAQPITIEAWLYPTTAGFAPIVEENTGGSNGEQLMYITTGQVIVFEQRNTHGYGSTIGLTTTATAPINTWTHFALCLTPSGPRIYVNGVQSATDATLRYWADAARNFNIGLNGYGGTGFPGYISNLRVSKGVRYTATFTPSTTPFVADSATSLLTCQSTLIEDTSYTQNTLTMTGTVKPLEFNPFGYNVVEVDNVPTSVGTSLIFDGTGDNLSIPTSNTLGLGTGDFTMECWVYPTSNPANGPGTIMDLRTGPTATATVIRMNASFQLMVYNGPSNVETTFTTVVAGLNAWYHIAYVRRSGTVYGYINSLLAGSVAISTDLGTTQPLLIGQNQSAGYNFYGYIYDFRISKGTGSYATSFLPIRAVKPAPGQTSFALNPTTVGIYDSAGQRGFSTEGDAKLSVVQKKYGSTSMYFDGTTDYLQFPYMERIMPTQSMTTASWTWECWVYIVARHTASDSWDWPVLFGGPGNIFAIGPTSIGRLRVQWYIGGSGGERRCTGSSTVPLTTWTHLAVAVTAGAFKFFINGVQETLDTSYSNSQTSFQNNIFTTTGTMYVGGGFGRGDFNGYIDDLRITNGYVRYTANFDAPAALVAAGPLT